MYKSTAENSPPPANTQFTLVLVMFAGKCDVLGNDLAFCNVCICDLSSVHVWMNGLETERHRWGREVGKY